MKKIKKGGRNYERGGIGKKAYEIIKYVARATISKVMFYEEV